MNREIKFRAWDKSENKIRKVRSINFTNKDLWLEIEDNRIMSANFFEVELMQYTGLKDKNDVEIYEGDIVKDSFNNITGEIISDNGCYWLRSNSKDRFENIIFKNLGEYVGEVLEVIGNVYQNKDLLEEK